MSRPNPKVDPRRADDLFRELLERVRTWIPAWQPPTQSGKDFGHALLHIAARLSAEATERLDRTPAKLALGLLDWLGITRHAGRAARMPVVFKMANGTTDSVLATAPVRIQANVGDTPITFETQEDVRLVPSPIQKLVGVDPAQDKIYFPPAEVLGLEAPESGPTEWTPKSLAIAGDKNKKIQLSPALGLKVGTILLVKSKVNDREYRFEYRLVAEPDGDIVTVEPPIGSLDPGSPSVPADAKDIDADTTTVSKVSSFIPFDGSSRNRQEHALYIGDDNALNLSAPACIALSGGAVLPSGLEWEYWGKVDENEPDWQGLESIGPEGTSLFLKKVDKGSIESYEIDGKKSRWIRAKRTANDKHKRSTFSQLGLLINCSPTLETNPDSVTAKCISASDAEPPKLEGVVNNTSLVLSERFYPFGKAPRQFDSFFLACPEVFSKKGAYATITLEIADLTLGRLAVVPLPEGGDSYLVFGVSKDGSLFSYKLSPDNNQPVVSDLKYTRPKPSTESGTGSNVDKTPVFHGAEFSVAPVVLPSGEMIFVYVASRRDIWQYSYYCDTWLYFGTISDEPSAGSISELIFLGVHSDGFLVALAEDALYTKRFSKDSPGNSPWSQINSESKMQWRRIAVIHNAKERAATRTDSLVALDNTGKIALFNFNTTQNKWVEMEIKQDGSLDDLLLDTGFTPLAIFTTTSRDVLLVGKAQHPDQQLLALVLTIPEADSQSVSISKHLDIGYSGNIIGSGFDFWVDEFDMVHVLFALNTQPGDTPQLARWAPLAPLDDDKRVPSDSVRTSGMGGGTLVEAPTVAGSRIVVPGISLDLMVTKLKTEPVGMQKPKDSSLLEGIITSQALNVKDFLELQNPQTTKNEYFMVDHSIRVKKDLEARNLYLTDPPLADIFRNIKVGLGFPSTATQLNGERVFNPNQLKLDNIPQNPASGDTLFLEYGLNNNLIYSKHKVNTFDPTTKTVTLEEELPENVPNTTDYQLYKPFKGKRIVKPDQLSLIDITLGLIVNESVLLLEYKKGNTLTYSKHTVTAVNQATNTVAVTPKLPSDNVDITTLKFQLYDFALEANVKLPDQLQLKTIPSDLVKGSILILKYNQDSKLIYSLHIVKDVSVTEDDSDTKTIITVSPNLPTVLKLNFQLYNAFPVEKDEEQNEDQTQLKRAAIPPGLVENILLIEYKQDSTLAYIPCIVLAVNLRNNTATFSPEMPADVKSNKLKFQLHNTLKVKKISQLNQLHLNNIPPGLVVNDILLLEYELDGADGTLVHSPHIVTTVDSQNKTVTVSPDLSTDAKPNTFRFQLYNAFQGERVFRPTNQLQLLNGIPDGLVGKELLLTYEQNKTPVYSKRWVVKVDDQFNNIVMVSRPDLPENIDTIEIEYQLYEPLKSNRVLARNLLQLSGGDLQSPMDSILLLYKPGGSHPCSKHVVSDFDPLKNIIEVNPFLPDNLGDTLPCFLYKETDIIKIEDIIVRPAILLKEFNDESLKILGETGTLYFKSPANPQRQSLAYDIAETTLPDSDQQVIKVAVLETPWTTRPTKDSDGNLEVAVEVKTSQDPWFRFIGDRSSNPELSWEYSREGGGWWGIPGLKDFTANLKANLKRSDTKLVGTIEFEVPTDLQPTDVLGQQSYWIRARLVGGDYGKETFVTTTTWTGERTQTQSVVVNTDNIRAPLVLSIKIAYSICKPIIPKYLLSFDSGSWRDQSDANRTGGAMVDAFVPIAELLRQMSGTAASPAGSPATAVAPCGCGNVAVSATVAGAPAATPASKASEAFDSRAIYLAFANKLEGGPIKLLFLLEDQDHDEAMPLRVEVLRDNRFEPVNAQDETRALGESGVITLSLDASPTQTELFGFPGFWIRLLPYKPEAPWRPRIRGAYANAVWAKAVETQEMEILGSSDGSPAQRFALIRSPILENGLELRVREPLGDEEMKQLIRTDKTVVKDDVPGLPGRWWVRWTEVPDPGDAGPDDRVYALDFASGEIRFGDGEHGAIPPIGRDAVVAFQYRHGGEAAANDIPSFTPLNLVTPIDGVEAAITPDHAAGGADPEADAAVLRFASAKLRHRDRAITLKDLEDLALDYSPFIAQARAFTTAQGARLVVVIAGSNPDPNQALTRELKRYLLDHASPALARKDALTIDKPEQVKFRLQISLTVASPDVTGRIVKETTEKVKAFFDPATGGYDRLGWRLGDSPTDADVAAQLIAIDNIEGTGNIRFSRVGDAATAAERLPIKSDQLAWLAPDGIKIEFLTGMVTT